MSAKHFHFTSLEQESLICARCGYCRDVCPIYQTVGWESATPRGKISLAREAYSLGGDAAGGEEFVHRIAQCTLCGACAQACTADIDTRKIWLEIRRRLAAEGRQPEGYATLQRNLLDNKNITAFANDERLDWAEDLDDPEPLEPRRDAEVCYFVGCVSSFYPQASEIAVSFAEILTEAGVDFTTMGGAEWCCGFPLRGSGRLDEADRFMRHNVEKIKELDIHTLITSCPSCYHVWLHEAADLLAGYDLQIFHATQYLDRLITDGTIRLRPWARKITYHDPCDLGRNSDVYEPPRRIIAAIPEAELVELAHSHADSLCCGGGGNLQSADPGLSEQIAALRIAEVRDSGAGVLVSACQQCSKILAMAARKANLKIKVMDINQLVRRLMVESGEA